MMAERVRFKKSTSEPNHSASGRFDAQSVPCEASEDLPMPPAASNEPKTSEFAFFKRLKQDVGHTTRRNPLNRKSSPVRKFKPSNYARELGNSKFDIKSAKKFTTGEIGSAVPLKEHNSGKFNSSSLLKTPTNIILDSFLSSTANVSVKPESQQNEGDVFSSKRQKLLQQIAKTLYPETNEVPTECNLVSLLLSRLLPECSQESLSEILPLRQPETEEENHSHFDLNIQLKETRDTSRKLLNRKEDNFLDTSASVAQFPRYLYTLPSGQTVEANTVTDDRISNKMLLGQREGNEHEGSLTRNFLTLGNELYGYSSPGIMSPKILANRMCMKFPYDSYGSGQSSEFRDHTHSYEVLNGSYDSFRAGKRSLLYKDEIRDINLDRRAQLSPNCWNDFSSYASFKRFQPSASNNLREYTERNYANDFEIAREVSPFLLGWDPDKSDISDSTHISHMELEVHRPLLLIQHEDHWDPEISDISGSTHTSHMELEIHRPLLSTQHEDHWDPEISYIRDSTHTSHMELDIYRPPSSTRKEDHWDNLVIGSCMHLSPYIYNDPGVQRHHLQEKALVLKSPRVSYMISHGPELNPDDSSLFKNTSKSSSFLAIPQKSYSSLENMMCERNYSGAEAFLISQDCESDFGPKCKSLTGFLKGEYEISTDDLHELFGRGNSSPQLVSDSANNLAISYPEDHILTKECVRVGEEVTFPLLLDTVNWEKEAQTYYGDKGTTTF